MLDVLKDVALKKEGRDEEKYYEHTFGTINFNQCPSNYSTKPDCQRAICSTSGSEPPSNTNRRALSRSIKAIKPSRNNATFSWTPVNSTALAYKSSSIITVVRINNLSWHKTSPQISHHYMFFLCSAGLEVPEPDPLRNSINRTRKNIQMKVSGFETLL